MQKENVPSSTKIPGLDLLRTLAILLVFFWHFQKNDGELTWLNWISRYGWSGVDLFFVLSGYLIAGQMLKPLRAGMQPDFKVFYFRRALRILPAYLAVVGLYFSIPDWNESTGLPPVWKFLTFTQNFDLDRTIAGGFSHAWSLCVEEHFYLLFPLLVFLGWKIKERISPVSFAIIIPLGVFLSGLMLRATLWSSCIAPIFFDPLRKDLGRIYDKVIYYPSYNRLDGLLAGVIIAMLFTFRPKLKQRLEALPNAPLVLGVFVIGLACVVTCDRTSLLAAVLGFPLFALGYGGLVASAALPGSWLNRIHVRGSTLMATLAYSFYLTHKELIHLFRPLLQRSSLFKNEAVMALATFSISLAGAFLLYVAVEKPFLRLRDRWLRPFTTCERA